MITLISALTPVDDPAVFCGSGHNGA